MPEITKYQKSVNSKSIKVLIIMPSYNEAESIENIIKHINGLIESFNDDSNSQSKIICNRLEESLDFKFTIVVINDCSKDDTSTIAKANGATVVDNYDHLGYGGSLQVGYRYAIDCNADFVIQMDSDGQHDSCNITKLLSKLMEGHDIVVGSRFCKGSKTYKIGLFKSIATKYFSWLYWLSIGETLSDTTSGLQGLSKEAFEFLSAYNNFDHNYPDCNILLNAARSGLDICEIPAVMHERSKGKSMHNGLKPFYYMLYMTLSVMVEALRGDIKKRKRKK